MKIFGQQQVAFMEWWRDISADELVERPLREVAEMAWAASITAAVKPDEPQLPGMVQWMDMLRQLDALSARITLLENRE